MFDSDLIFDDVLIGATDFSVVVDPGGGGPTRASTTVLMFDLMATTGVRLRALPVDLERARQKCLH